MIPDLVNHVWQSTVFAGLAGLLTLVLRKNRAGARYWVWLAASVKFLVPFAAVAVVGSHLTWTSAAVPAAPRVAAAIAQSEAFVAPARSAPATRSPAPLYAIAWAGGFVVVIFCRARQWRRMQQVVRTAVPLPMAGPIPVKASRVLIEPGVFGVFRPVLLLPDGIRERLAPEQFRAILAHEWTHVRRHDNLAATLHLFVEAIFWFHPLVWWIGARLVEERERACDEAVFAQGHDPEAYAEGILRVCRFYLESRLPCVAGVTGSDLKKRIECILARHAGHRLESGKRLLLVTLGAAAVAVPLGVGLLQAPAGRAQTTATDKQRPSFEVASIKPGDPQSPRFGILLQPSGRFVATNATLRQLISYAYDVRSNQITGGTSWSDSEIYSVEAKPDPAAPPLTGQAHAEQTRLMLQSLLAERFELAIHWVSKDEPVYELAVAKNGPKLKEAAEWENEGERVGRNQITGTGAPIALLIKPLSQLMGRSIVDRTKLTGKYDFSVQWTPPPGPFRLGDAGEPPADPDGISVFTALEEQLGLQLRAARGSVEILVIDHAQKPSVD